MTVVDLLVLVPWLIFGAGLAAIGYRLSRHGTARRHRRHSRLPPGLAPMRAGSGFGLAPALRQGR